MEEAKRAIGLTPNPTEGANSTIFVSCHGPEGWGSSNGYYPQVAGQLTGVIIKQLADIRARNRDNPTMFPFPCQVYWAVQEMADEGPISPHRPCRRLTIQDRDMIWSPVNGSTRKSAPNVMVIVGRVMRRIMPFDHGTALQLSETPV